MAKVRRLFADDRTIYIFLIEILVLKIQIKIIEVDIPIDFIHLSKDINNEDIAF